MQTDLLISVPFIFFLSLMVGLILYRVGGRIGVKGEKSKDKFVPYACGEDLPPHKLQVDAERFLIMLFISLFSSHLCIHCVAGRCLFTPIVAAKMA